jgi:hypothetical protein
VLYQAELHSGRGARIAAVALNGKRGYLTCVGSERSVRFRYHPICPVKMVLPLGVLMRWSEVLEGVRMLKFRSVFDRWECSELSQLVAAELLGVGERTFRRW